MTHPLSPLTCLWASFLILTSAFCSAATAQDVTSTGTSGGRPVILWISSPVHPGETVLIHGGDFGDSPTVEITSPMGTKTVTPLKKSETSLMFPFPEDWPETEASVRVHSEQGTSAPKGVNALDVWWIQGDNGEEASPGGWIRLFGNGIQTPDGKPREFELLDEGGEPVGGIASQESLNRWSQRIQLNSDIKPGRYQPAYRGGAEDRWIPVGSLSIEPHGEVWKMDRFSVVDFGAIPNDGQDDTEAILNAVKQLTANGGGILYFPRGRFQMRQTIEIPPKSLIQGVSRDLSMIYWPDTDTPPTALIKGTHSFGVENIFLTSGFHLDGIVGNTSPTFSEDGTSADHSSEQNGFITIRHVTMRLLYSEYVNDHLDKLKERLGQLHGRRALRFGGKFIRVTDCDIYSAAGGVFDLYPHWGEITNNRFCRGNVIGWNGIQGRQILFENNHLGGANCTSFYGTPEMSENVYWGSNFHENTFDGNNRETLTGDGRTHFYLNTVEKADETSLTLAGDATQYGKFQPWRRGFVQIAANRGVGQVRRIRSLEEKEGKLLVTVDQPWEICPDKTSVFYIGTGRGHFIYTQNRVFDSTISLQLYGLMTEAIIADNVTSRTGGYNGDSMNGETSWFLQFLGNTIESGNTFRSPRNEIPATDAQLGLLSYGAGFGDHDYSLVRSCVVRNNRLLGNAKLNVLGPVIDSVLEKNTVENADRGITLSKESKNILLRDNHFENVLEPIVEY